MKPPAVNWREPHKYQKSFHKRIDTGYFECICGLPEDNPLHLGDKPPVKDHQKKWGREQFKQSIKALAELGDIPPISNEQINLIVNNFDYFSEQLLLSQKQEWVKVIEGMKVRCSNNFPQAMSAKLHNNLLDDVISKLEEV